MASNRLCPTCPAHHSNATCPWPALTAAPAQARMHNDNPERQLGALEAGQNLGDAASNPGPAAGGAAGRAQSCSFCAPRPGARDTSAGEGKKITGDEAITIFRARSPRDRKFKHSSISNELAEAFGISQKAVRDIWNLRTWWEVTRPFWSAQDYQRFHAKYGATRMCAACRQAGHAIAWQGVMSQPGQSQSAAGGSAVGSAANQQGLTGHFMAGQMPVSTATRHNVFASVLQPAFSWLPASSAHQHAGQVPANPGSSWSGPITQPVAETAHSLRYVAPAVSAASSALRPAFSWPPASSAHQHAGQVPANPGSSWSGPVTQPVAESAHSLRYVAPAVSAASRSQGAASASIETGTQAGQVGLAPGRPRGDDAAVGTFIDGWAIPLTPPDVGFSATRERRPLPLRATESAIACRARGQGKVGDNASCLAASSIPATGLVGDLFSLKALGSNAWMYVFGAACP